MLSIIDPIVEKGFIVYGRLVYHNDTIRYGTEFSEVRIAGLAGNPESTDHSFAFSISTGFKKTTRAGVQV